MEYDNVIQRLVQDYVEGCGYGLLHTLNIPYRNNYHIICTEAGPVEGCGYGLFHTTVGKTKCILH